MDSATGKDKTPASVSKLSKLCEILHDIEASTSHLSRGVDYAKRLASSGPVMVEEMTMHLRWVGNHYTIVVNCEDTVTDLKIAVFQALRVQPRLQRMLNWNVMPHAQPVNDNTLLKDCNFQKDARLIKIGKTYVRLVKFHTQTKKKIVRHEEHKLGGPRFSAFLSEEDLKDAYFRLRPSKIGTL